MVQRSLSLNQWEEICFGLFAEGTDPREINWLETIGIEKRLNKSAQDQLDLFAFTHHQKSRVNRRFQEKIQNLPFYGAYCDLCRIVLCHKSESKFKHLYSLFCKACSDPRILMNNADEDVYALSTIKNQVIKELHS